jgi:hypothetical protein
MSRFQHWTRRINGYRWFLKGTISVLNKISAHTGVNTSTARQALIFVDRDIARRQEWRKHGRNN